MGKQGATVEDVLRGACIDAAHKSNTTDCLKIGLPVGAVDRLANRNAGSVGQ